MHSELRRDMAAASLVGVDRTFMSSLAKSHPEMLPSAGENVSVRDQFDGVVA
jgi:hypothetical protein